MVRCGTIALALAGLGSMAGCQQIGQTMRTPQAPPPGAPARTYDAPINRVLAAVMAADQPDFRFGKDTIFDFPGAGISDRGMKAMNDALASGKPTLRADVAIEDFTFGSARITGKTTDGRDFTVWLVDLDPGKKTEVKVHIGKTHDAALNGDIDRITAYLDRIVDKLAHPSHEPMQVDFDFNIASRPVARGQKFDPKPTPVEPAAAPEKRGPE